MRRVCRSCLLLFFLLGCALKVSPPLSTEQALRNQALFQSIRSRAASIGTLTGLARIRIKTPEESLAADFVILIRMPDSLRLEMHAPLGGMQWLLIIRNRRGVVWTPDRPAGKTFPVDSHVLKRYLWINLSFSEFLEALLGGPPVSDVAVTRLRSRIEDQRTVLEIVRNRHVLQRIWMDDSGEVSRWERLDREGRMTASLLFEEYTEKKGIPVPLRITYRAKDGTELILRYRSLHLNRPVEDRSFQFPEVHRRGTPS